MKFYSFPMLACALLMLCALPSVAFADTIMPDTHSIEKCVKITGLDAYPSHTFVGAVSPIMSGGQPEFVKIANNDCIVTGSHYKFDSFSIYHMNKSYYEKVGFGGIKTGNVSSNGRQGVVDKNLTFVGGEQASAPYAPYYVSDSDAAKSVTIEYRLEKSEGGYKLTKVKEEKSSLPLNETGNDLPPAPPGEPHAPTPQNPAPTQLEPFQALWCWLMGIFGAAC